VRIFKICDSNFLLNFIITHHITNDQLHSECADFYKLLLLLSEQKLETITRMYPKPERVLCDDIHSSVTLLYASRGIPREN
jgi:hypothetical protein